MKITAFESNHENNVTHMVLDYSRKGGRAVELIKYLHEKVEIKLKNGKIIRGTVENMDNDFETDSGEDEITISQKGKDYETAIRESEIEVINKICFQDRI